jgi:hypothetical protein
MLSGWLKKADAPPSATAASAASPLPTPSIQPTFAAGLKGPAGMAPRTNYARVNTGTPLQPDAGSEAQKSMQPRGAEMLPKRASADGDRTMGNMAGRPMIQDLIKSAMVTAAQRSRVTDEAHLQAEKTASEEEKKCEKCGKEKDACSCAKTGSAVAHDLGEKLAGALDHLASELMKNAEGHLGGPYNLTEHLQGPPAGVSQATASTSLPDHKGQATPAKIIPTHTANEKGLPTEHGQTKAKTDYNDPPAFHERMIQTNYGKQASVADIVQSKLAAQKTAADAEKEETKGLEAAKAGLEHAEAAHKEEPENKGEKKASLVDYMAAKIKQAEDAINPAKITAGAAVPPQTSQAGQPGGAPVGGPPKGPTGLVASNDGARNYQKGTAYANRKEDMHKYLKEPMLSMEHDSVLRDAFKHTAQAGTKFAAATAAEPNPGEVVATELAKTAAAKPAPINQVAESTKLAAGKVLLSRLAADIDAAQAAAAQ